MKKLLTPINVITLIWGSILLILSNWYPEYVRYYLYLSIIIMVPFMIFNLMKQREQDKLNGTKKVVTAIARMIIVSVVLIVFIFITKQKHI